MGDFAATDYVLVAVAVLVLVTLGTSLLLLTRGRGRRDEPPASDQLDREPAVGDDAGSPPPPSRPVETLDLPDGPLGTSAAARPSLRDRLGRSRSALARGLGRLLGHDPDDDAWDGLEEALVAADVGVEASTALVERLRQRARTEGASGDALRALLRDELLTLLEPGMDRSLHLDPSSAGAVPSTGTAAENRPGPAAPKGDAQPAGTTGASAATGGSEADGQVAARPSEPAVVLVVGVNGTGKTTSVGKLARHLVGQGHTPLLAAADTFRAAAADQLSVWGERVNVPVVRQGEGADPAAVAFDGLAAARGRGCDVLLVDTAGRLHTKANLMEELKKIRRVLEREGGRITEVLLVLDATTGQNGVVQARRFAEAVGVTGIVLTKLDGTARGGVVVAVQRELGVPVKYVGLGEGPDDLTPFDPVAFVDALLADENDVSSARAGSDG